MGFRENAAEALVKKHLFNLADRYLAHLTETSHALGQIADHMEVVAKTVFVDQLTKISADYHARQSGLLDEINKLTDYVESLTRDGSLNEKSRQNLCKVFIHKYEADVTRHVLWLRKDAKKLLASMVDQPDSYAKTVLKNWSDMTTFQELQILAGSLDRPKP